MYFFVSSVFMLMIVWEPEFFKRSEKDTIGLLFKANNRRAYIYDNLGFRTDPEYEKQKNAVSDSMKPYPVVQFGLKINK